jgi:hypothetical protein
VASAVEIVFVASLSTAELVIVPSTDELDAETSIEELVTVLVASDSTTELGTTGEEVTPSSVEEL